MNPCISNAKTLEEKTTSSQFIISKGAKSALACSDNSKEWLQAICFLLGHRMKIQLKPILSLCICVGQFFTMVTQIMNMGNSKSKFEDGNVAAPSKRLGKNGRFWLIEWVLISIAEHASKYPVKSPQCFTWINPVMAALWKFIFWNRLNHSCTIYHVLPLQPKFQIRIPKFVTLFVTVILIEKVN